MLAFVCETYNASPCSVSHADSDKFYHSLITILEEQIDGSYADLDFTRISVSYTHLIPSLFWQVPQTTICCLRDLPFS